VSTCLSNRYIRHLLFESLSAASVPDEENADEGKLHQNRDECHGMLKVVPYDPRWPEMFRAESIKLGAAPLLKIK
jgi:hypothetical protein